MNSKLSIILTIYGRNEYTHRWCAFLSQNYCGSQIIIADGNSSPQPTKKIIENFKNLNITHLWIKEDNGVDDFIFKIKNALSHSKGDYVVFADNDDLLNEKIILKNIDRMVQHHFQIGLCESYRFVHNKKRTVAYKLQNHPFANCMDATSRLKASIMAFPSDYIYYAIFRKDVLNNCFNSMVHRRLNYWIFMEFAITCIFATKVSQKKLLEAFLFRDAGTFGTAKSLVDKEAFANLIFDENFYQSYCNLCQIVGEQAELDEVGIKKLRVYLENEIRQRIFRRYITQKNYLPRYLIKILSYIYLLLHKKNKNAVGSRNQDLRSIDNFLKSYDNNE